MSNAAASPPASPPASPLAQPDAWNLVSDAYTAEALPFFEAFSRDALALAKVGAGEPIVDVATGPGTLALMAAQAGAKVSALDFSSVMIANLERRAAELGMTGLDVRLGDGQALPYADGGFEAGFSMFGLIFFPDRAAGLRELRRVLRPGGRVVISSWAPFTGAFVLMMESLRRAMPGLPFGQGKAPLGEAAEMEAELVAAGLRDVKVHTVEHNLEAPSLAEFWAGSQRTTAPLVLLRRKLGETEWAKVSQAIFEDMRKTVGDGPIVNVGRAHLGVGVK